jgi:cyanobactin maturation PatA/PatG family protease
VQILGVSPDSVETNAAFVEKYSFPFPLLSDPDRKICLAYHACDSSSDRAKRVTYIIGPEGTILQVHEDIDTEHHAEAILSSLDRISDTAQPDSLPSVDTQVQASSCGCIPEIRNGKMDDQRYEVENGQLQDDEGVAVDETVLSGVERQASASANGGGGRVFLPDSGLPLWGSIPAILPSQAGGESSSSGPALVYALGTVGYDFGSEAQQDSLAQAMGEGANPNDAAQLLAYLDNNPHEATAVLWTLNQEGTPIYAIQPAGPFASVAYERLREFLRDQTEEAIERVSLPGYLAGSVRLLSGQVVPVVVPEPRGMFSWRTPNLVNAVLGEAPRRARDRAEYEQKQAGIHNFLERVYYELRNLGLTPQERAVNYAATNAFQVNQVFAAAVREELALANIAVERSPICRPGSDCWDVKLTFFAPRNRLERAKQVFRMAVDVSSVVPATVGSVRSWAEY